MLTADREQRHKIRLERHQITPLGARIIARIRAIPVGFVSTYGDVDPHAPRAVGRLLATTGESLPWHRVIRADGSLPLGERQRELLLAEDVPMRGERVDLRRAMLRSWRGYDERG